MGHNVKLADATPGHQRPTGSGSFDQSKEERSDLLERDLGEAGVRGLAAPRRLHGFGLFGWSLFLLWRHFLEKSHKLTMSRSFHRLIKRKSDDSCSFAFDFILCLFS